METFSYSEGVGIWSLEALFPDSMINVDESNLNNLLVDSAVDCTKTIVSQVSDNRKSEPEVRSTLSLEENDLQDWMDKNVDFSFTEGLEHLLTSFVDKTDIDDVALITSDEALDSLKNSNSSDTTDGSINIPTNIIDDSFSVHSPPQSPVGEVPDSYSVLSFVSSKSGVLSSTVDESSPELSVEVSPNTQNTSISFKVCGKGKNIQVMKSIISSCPTNTASTARWLLEELNNSDALPVDDPDNFEIENKEVSGDNQMKQHSYKPYSFTHHLCERPCSRIKSVGGSSSKGFFADKRKERKKKQNKEAATRYRHKKQAEYQVLVEKEKILEEYNHELKDKVQQLTSEISYLKGLMKELFKVKNW
ncbi:cyclic AMP-dependent transcription factor ATF-4-like [Limulus polyphemus]|uniref:Cyclic AMP-dependent transcription factor ATF-4-like n=1 Tax=Limulus polyphemus TaxID=6850 RepID=A0ABM1BZT2_LIMPO|nr:cyclic AMP-dependent transcription factor ATF-4-like [Limulus polyphemus]XP_022235389.1 cyclic AMP-dependent transcription factor ATF-4-like [Limulus polyphemus]